MDDLGDVYISKIGEIRSKKEWIEWGKQYEKLSGTLYGIKITMPWEKIVRLLKLVKYPEN